MGRRRKSNVPLAAAVFFLMPISAIIPTGKDDCSDPFTFESLSVHTVQYVSETCVSENFLWGGV